MDDEPGISLSELKEKIREVADGVGVRELPLEDEFLEEFCELTGHDYSHYLERNQIPTGFFMTFTSPIVTQVFLSFFLKHPKLIKGVIHTGSKVEISSPLRLDKRPYSEKLEVREIVEKSGAKGKYLAVDFQVILMDSSGQKAASDLHQFFLRI